MSIGDKMTIKNERKSSKFKLDHVDERLIEELRRNGRVSLVKLGKAVGIRHSSVRNRLLRLIKEGYMRIEANLSLRKLGLRVAFVLMDVSDVKQALFITERLSECPRVAMIGLTTGDYNVFMILIGKEYEDIRSFIEKNLRSIRGMRKLSVSYGEIVYPDFMPLELFSRREECKERCASCELLTMHACDGCMGVT